jgi:flagellar motility protein MotE (MotC chaperone)
VKNLRLIPLVVLAALGLLTLKVVDLFVPITQLVASLHSGSETDPMPTGSVIGKNAVPQARTADTNTRNRINLLSNWSVDALTDQGIDPVVTGSSEGSAHDAPKDAAAPADPMQLAPADVKTTVSNERPKEATPLGPPDRSAETKILNMLGSRRQELETRAHDLDIREGLLKATETKIEQRIDDLKVLEDKIGSGAQKREETKEKELAGLVKMYETMKPKDAARVFDKLDASLLVDLARQMNPKKLAEVVAKMQPDVAEKLTVGLANRKENAPVVGPGRELPKIPSTDG